MIKLIATDMDGTLLRDDKTFASDFYDYYPMLKKQQIKFVVASGNQYDLLKSKFNDEISDELIYVAENGCKVVIDNQTIYKNTVSDQNIRQILKQIENYPDCMCVLCGDKQAYVLNRFKEKESYFAKFYRKYKFVESFDTVQDDFLKISICNDTGNIATVARDVKAALPSGIKLVTTGNVWFDIFNDDINKGKALQLVMDHFGLSNDECAAFGDMHNDIELLRDVKYSYAMANACNEVKQVAYEVIGDNNSDAVVKQIKKIIDQEY